MRNNQELEAQKERKDYLAKVLHQIKRDYKAKEKGASLKILEPILESLVLTSAADVIENTTPSLLMSLRIALQGIALEESPAGVIGVHLNNITKSIAGLVVNAPLSGNNAGTREFFLYLLYALEIAVIAALCCLEETDIKNQLPVDDERDPEDPQLFELELILMMVYRTSVIETLIKHMLIACGIKEEGLKVTTQFLKGCVTLLSIFTAGRQDLKTMKTLCLGLKDYVRESLADIQKFIASLEQTDHLSELSIYMQQAEISLLDEDMDALLTIYTEALGLIKCNPESIRADIEKVEPFARIIKRAFSSGWMNVNQATVAHLI